MSVTIIACDAIGVNGTTPVHVHFNGTWYEARVGIAIMGSTNMDKTEFEACDYDPFHEDFRDNFASGFGDTQEQAIAAMRADMKSIARTLWL